MALPYFDEASDIWGMSFCITWWGIFSASNSPDNSRRAGQRQVGLQEVVKGYCHLTPFILLMLWRTALVTADNTSKDCSSSFLARLFSLHECVIHSSTGLMAPSARRQCQMRNHTRAAYLSNQNAEGESREDGNLTLSGRARAHLFLFSGFF